MKNKNILELCLSPDLGGLELFMLKCYDYFKEHTQSHLVISQNSKLDKYLDKSPNLYLKRNKFLPIIPALKLAQYIDKHKIDIVHFHWTKDIATAVLAKSLCKRKIKIIQTRNMTMTRFKDDIYHKWLYKNIHTMHAVTHQVKDQLTKFIPQDVRPNIEVIYMGTKTEEIDKKQIKNLKDTYNIKDEFIVGIVGRIQENKGQFLVIEAIARLQDLNIKALIVGHTMDENYLQALKQKVKKLGIENKVIFTGFTKAVNEHMSLCNATVLATPKETFGLVVIESMMNKTPVIATNKGGPLEIIHDKVDGLLFDRTVDDLTSKIKFLYDNPEFTNTLSKECHKSSMQRFDNDTQLNKLYKTIVSS